MKSSFNSFIQILQKSRLAAECPHCGEEFKLSKALLFDGRKPFPEQAEQKRVELESELQERLAGLVKKRDRADTASEKSAISIGIGKIIEKVLPAHKDFSLIPSDCRFLAEPIDMVVFNGASQNKINSITFMDVKTGNARLNTHQKQIRDAVEDKKVRWKVL